MIVSMLQAAENGSTSISSVKYAAVSATWSRVIHKTAFIINHRFHASEVPLGTGHGAEPLGASELSGRSELLAVLTLEH